MNCVDDKLKEELLELSRYIYDNPELGYEEYKASAAHAALLEKHGFQVQRGYLGIETEMCIRDSSYTTYRIGE